MFNTIVGPGAVGAGAVGAGAGAAARYGSGSSSDQMMRLLAAPAPRHWIFLPCQRSKKILIIKRYELIFNIYFLFQHLIFQEKKCSLKEV
jgi:hypothetical protein